MRSLLVKVLTLVCVSAALAGVLVTIFDNLQVQPERTYKAMFTNVSGLVTGDDVRAAGVDVGRVQGVAIQPGTGNQVLVTFTVSDAVSLTRDTTLTVRYADVIGNRYLEVGRPVASSPPLPADAVIPASQTQPALSLDALFNGFQPLFQGLQPAQVNELSAELISVLQGEGGTIDGLLTSIGSVTSTLADRDRLIGQVIGNLNAVLGTVSSRDTQLSAFVVRLQQLVSGLAADRGTIGNSIGDIAGVTGNLAGLLQGARPGIAGTVTQVSRLSTVLNSQSAQINSELHAIPQAYSNLDREGLYGSFFNFYLCGVSLRLTGANGQPMDTPMFESEAKRCQS